MFSPETKITLCNSSAKAIKDLSIDEEIMDMRGSSVKLLNIEKTKTNDLIKIKFRGKLDLYCSTDVKLYNLNIIADSDDSYLKY